MKLVDALAASLRDWDLGYVFGVSGANIEHLHDAIHRLGHGRLQSVLAKSEVGAAFMADCRARVHNTLGVCCATSGGGMMNLAVGIAEAYADGVPVLAIVGQPPTALEGKGAFQDSSGIGQTVDALGLWTSISKFTTKIAHADQFWPALSAAIDAALNDRPGPAILLIPRDIYDKEVGPRPADLPKSLDKFLRPGRPDPDGVRELFQRLQAARSPVLLLGPGVIRGRDTESIAEFARLTGTRVVTTLAAKAAFPNEDPHFLGMAGVAGEPSVHRYLEREADLIVAVGTTLDIMTRSPVQTALATERLAVVGVDVERTSRAIPPAIAVRGEPGAVFEALCALALSSGSPPRTLNSVPVYRYVPRLARQVDFDDSPEDAVVDGQSPDDLLQSAAMEILQSALPRTGHMLFDAGNCAAAALHALRIPPGVTSTIALGMGGMGYAIAGSIGAQLGAPADCRTLVLCGDGAFLMQGYEIHTAIHYQLPILFVVFNNRMHGMCVTRQQLYFDGRVECAHYPRISASTVAEGLAAGNRLWTRSVGTPLDLADALDEYYRGWSDSPGVLELQLSREEVPPFTPFLPADEPTYYVSENSSSAGVQV